MRRRIISFVAVAMTLGFAAAADAATITLSTSGASPAGSSLADFDSLALHQTGNIGALPGIPGATLNLSNAEIIVNSLVGHYAAPWLGAGQETTQYVTVNTNGAPGQATINLGTAANYFGLLWGSVDKYNSIAFYDGNTLLDHIFTGAEVPGVNFGSWFADGTVYAHFNSDTLFNKIVLSSTGIALEFDNVRFANTPLPAALPMFGAALAGLGAFARRRNKKAAA